MASADGPRALSRIRVVTLEGEDVVHLGDEVSPSSTVDALKRCIHQKGCAAVGEETDGAETQTPAAGHDDADADANNNDSKSSSARGKYPEPQNQRLVFRGRELKCGTLGDAGIVDESTVVVVARRDISRYEKPAIDFNERPSMALISSMTNKLAARKGKPPGQSHLGANPESRGAGADGSPHRLNSSGGGVSASMASISDIQQLLNAMSTVTYPPTGGSDGFAADAMETDASQQENAPVDEDGEGERGSTGDDGGRVPMEEEDQDVELPEANAQRLQQLVDMGFSEDIARKALILRHNNIDAAMDWILEHQDTDAATPLSESELRQIALSQRRARQSRRRLRRRFASQSGAFRRGGPPVEVDAGLVTQLEEMGFSTRRARFALQTFRNNLELACQWLLASADDVESSEEDPDQEQEQEQDEAGFAQNALRSFIDNPSVHQVSPTSQPAHTHGQRRWRPTCLSDSSMLTGLLLASGALVGCQFENMMQSERLIRAFHAMIESPRGARSYLTDPEIGPILLQIQRAQQSSAMGTTSATGEPEQTDPENAGEPREGSGENAEQNQNQSNL